MATVMRGRTTIVIAHRPGTIALADTVVLVDDGRCRRTGHARRSAGDERAVPRGAGCARRRGGRARLAATRRRTRATSAKVVATDVGWRRRQRRGSRSTGPRLHVSCGASLEFARPYRRTCIVGDRLGHDLNRVHPRRAGAREVRNRPTASPGQRGALNLAVVAYFVAVVVAATSSAASSSSPSTAPARGSCATCGSRVFDRLQAQSMAFFDRNKAGVLVVADDRRHREHGRADPVGPAAVRRPPACCSC